MDQALLDDVLSLPAKDLWPRVFDWAWTLWSAPMADGGEYSQLVERERSIAPLDNLLSGSAWELWDAFGTAAPKTSAAVQQFWQTTAGGKAVLVLDALSLREAAWLLEQAEARGFQLHGARATASEIPPNTTPFAKALGFSQRSALANGTGSSAALPGAKTETSDLPFADCKALVPTHPDVVFWHHWPDERMHKLAEHSGGYRTLVKESAELLRSDGFWGFVETLTTGRRLVITADHGYANVALFPDVEHKAQAQALKTTFKSGRNASGDTPPDLAHWVPPLTRQLSNEHGDWSLVLGRKKWKSQGGYPTLAHGGLSLLEVAVPFIELSRV